MSGGELLKNGGMESFTDNIPTGWTTTTPERVSQDTARGRVHSGDSAAALTNGADLSQVVPVNGGCFYELSFFGHGEGALVGVTATVTFLSAAGSTIGLQIIVNRGDMPNSSRDFGYYRAITTQAPAGATSARITFVVTSQGGQYLDLDDVSFSVA